jgi:hypothetical protein
MSNQPIKSNKYALHTLHKVILNDVDEHEDNQQLLLFIGIELNDIDIVRSCMEYENLDANQGITARNQKILEELGCDFSGLNM